ncbi:hypothetical protein GCM10011331_13260 [Flavimobilis marinus]|uniref:Uncharacterized protein n=1 Tax=Flavimobilis marinus TaxID=285351 RepID=A0A1I2G1B1_9MICO|nr:hypothetical protein [Flavimobilis marinus]GHG50534.1 hypothetical protein GCM10011331_13260 [Flavimobilis marinus]SFF10918.1 hypothetical protein SAMN04488035_1642 [Flavimobilis marinus]
MTSLRASLAALMVIVLTATACGSGVREESPSLDEASAVLADIVGAAQSDPAGLCAYAASENMCQTALKDAGPPPPDEPVVRCEGTVAATETSSAGRILQVEGATADGGSYSTSMLTFYDGKGAVVVINPVYWKSTGIGLGTEQMADGGPVKKFC